MLVKLCLITHCALNDDECDDDLTDTQILRDVFLQVIVQGIPMAAVEACKLKNSKPSFSNEPCKREI